jgi:hypothetical protein
MSSSGKGPAPALGLGAWDDSWDSVSATGKRSAATEPGNEDGHNQLITNLISMLEQQGVPKSKERVDVKRGGDFSAHSASKRPKTQPRQHEDDDSEEIIIKAPSSSKSTTDQTSRSHLPSSPVKIEPVPDPTILYRPELQVGQRVRLCGASAMYAGDNWPGLTKTLSTGYVLLDVHGVVRRKKGRNFLVQWFAEGVEPRLYDTPPSRIYSCLPDEWSEQVERRYKRID